MTLTVAFALFVFAPAFKATYTALAVLMIASVGLAIGALWEVAEWAFDRFTEANSVKGKHDTILDIIMDTIGALGGGLISIKFLRSPSE